MPGLALRWAQNLCFHITLLDTWAAFAKYVVGTFCLMWLCFSDGIVALRVCSLLQVTSIEQTFVRGDHACYALFGERVAALDEWFEGQAV